MTAVWFGCSMLSRKSGCCSVLPCFCGRGRHFSSLLIDFPEVRMNWSILQWSLTEDTSRNGTALQLFYLKKFSWRGYLCFSLISADLACSLPTRQSFIVLFYRKHSSPSCLLLSPSLRLIWGLSVLLFMVTSISWPISMPDSNLQQSDQEW